MIQRAFGHAGRLVVLGLCTAVAVLVAATASSAATSVNVACGDSAGLVAGVNTVNAAGGGSINLAAGCMYSLTTRNNTVMGGNGLPVISVDMGLARLDWREIPVREACDTNHMPVGLGPLQDPVGTNMGNPHATFFVDDLDRVPLAELGPTLEHDRFFPERANIGVGVAVVARDAPGDLILGSVFLDSEERIWKLLVRDLLNRDRLINFRCIPVRAHRHQLKNEMGLGRIARRHGEDGRAENARSIAVGPCACCRDLGHLRRDRKR